MSDVEFGVVSTDGTVQHADADRINRSSTAFDRELEYAEKAGTHLWIAVAGHRLSDAQAKRVANGSDEPVIMDLENLAIMGISCYRCEEPLNRRLIDRRCPGDPA